ncbi:MAG: hypothetical protein MSIBF_04680 [Candidatus Altiarchaeales archaeon IMC4]|nr:MAG: hypothetical protein MSIBF_04680 [Candidatus Altiarchaeales archaeon IMC4]
MHRKKIRKFLGWFEKNPYDAFTAVFIAMFTMLLLQNVHEGLAVTDEATYLLMADAFSNGNFEIWNGYEETPANELVIGWTTVQNGKLYGAYPMLYPVIVYPFYKIFGFIGLFIVNVVSFAIVLWLIYLLCNLLLGDKLLSSFAVVTYAFFTYAMKFSIELWPHSLSLCLVLASVFLVLRSFYANGSLFLAGLLSGTAIGIRYTDVLFSMVLFIFIMFKFRRGLASFSAGLFLPVFLLLSANSYVYGSPFGTGYSGVSMQVVYAAIALFVLTAAFMSKVSIRFSFLIFIALGITLSYALSLDLTMYTRVLYADVVDIGAFPEQGQGVWWYKKSLLQSTPLFILALIAPVMMHRRKVNKDTILILVILSVIEPLFFSTRMHHGGDVLTMRYLLEATPFLAIMSCYVIRNSIRLENFGRWEIFIAIGTFMALVFASMLVLDPDQFIYSSIFVFRVLPLIIAALLLITVLCGKRAAPVLFFLLIFAYSYCFLTAVTDLVESSGARYENMFKTAELLGGIEDNSLVMFGNSTDIMFTAPAKLEKGVRVAYLQKGTSSLEFYKRGIHRYVVVEKEYDIEGILLPLGYNYSIVETENLKIAELK